MEYILITLYVRFYNETVKVRNVGRIFIPSLVFNSCYFVYLNYIFCWPLTLSTSKKVLFCGVFFICLLFFLMYLLSLFCYVLVTMFREALYKALLLSLLLLLLLILSVSFFSLSCSKIFRLFNFQVSATTVQPQGASERVVF